MKFEGITIKDIAKAINVSYSTVSRALKDSPHIISNATKVKVKEYALKHRYRPNLTAQSLKNKGSRCIGVMVGSIPDNFFSQVIHGIESIAFDKNYQVIVTQNLESYQREQSNLDHLASRSIEVYWFLYHVKRKR